MCDDMWDDNTEDIFVSNRYEKGADEKTYTTRT